MRSKGSRVIRLHCLTVIDLDGPHDNHGTCGAGRRPELTCAQYRTLLIFSGISASRMAGRYDTEAVRIAMEHLPVQVASFQ